MGVPFVDLLSKLFPTATMTALDNRYKALDTGWTALDGGSGWTPSTTDPIRIRRLNKRVEVTGTIRRSGASAPLDNLFTIPVGMRLTGPYALANVGAGVASNNVPVQFAVNADVHRFSIRATPNIPQNTDIYVSAIWYTD